MTIVGDAWYLPHFVTNLSYFPLIIYDFVIIRTVYLKGPFAH